MKRRLSIESTREINLKLPLVEAKETPSKGDTVQIKPNVPRRSWESTVNRPLTLRYPIECESTVNDTTEKSEQLSNRNTRSQEKLDKSTKESTLQKPTRRSAQKANAGAQDKILGCNLQEELN